MAELIPIGYDKLGPKFSHQNVNDVIVGMISAEAYFERRVKFMSTEIEKAIEKTNTMTQEFSDTLEKFIAMEGKVTEQAKKASGSIRDSAAKLAQGIERVEKAANFDRLERYVVLLERASKAMNELAMLHESGKLEKISAAIR